MIDVHLFFPLKFHLKNNILTMHYDKTMNLITITLIWINRTYCTSNLTYSACIWLIDNIVVVNWVYVTSHHITLDAFSSQNAAPVWWLRGHESQISFTASTQPVGVCYYLVLALCSSCGAFAESCAWTLFSSLLVF